MKFKITALLLICYAIMNGQKSIAIPKALTKASSVEGITEYNMENGLKVLLFPDQSKNTITVNITYLVGSRHEAYGETGMAHLLEHLVFKGTPNHPNIPAELTEHGCRPNGTTWYDRTNYFETFTASDENLEWALDLEADRMINSFIAKKDLDSEMTVVRNEYERGENNPSSVLMKRVLGSAFLWHNYGNTTIGARADIENVPIDRLKAFYKKYYQPDNAVLMVTGQFEVEKTLQLIADKFGPIPRPERKLIPTYTKEPTQDGERHVTLRRVGDIQNIACAYHVPPGTHADFASISVLKELLTNQTSGRLTKALIDTKKSPYLWGFAPPLREGGFMYLSVDVRKENSLEDAQSTLLTSLDELVSNPPTEEEVDRAKSQILKNWDMAFNNSGRVGVRMSEAIAAGDWRLFFLYRDNVEKVNAKSVFEVAKKYLIPSNRTIGTFIPDDNPKRVEIPDAPSIDLLVDGYKGRASIAEGEAFDPSPENIKSRTTIDNLETGMQYAMLQKETRGDAAVARLTLRYGTPKSLLGKSTAAEFTSYMLDKGTEDLTRQELTDKLDALKASVRAYGGKSSVTVRIETINENLPEVIDLVADMVKKPSFNQDEFEKLKEEELAWLEEQMSDPQALANIAYSKLLNPYPVDDIRYVADLPEQKENAMNVTIDEVKQFHRDFYGSAEATFSVIGDFEPEAVNAKLNEHFATWVSNEDYERISDPHIEVKSETLVIKTPDKKNAMFFAGMNVPVNDTHEDYAALILGNYILGGGFLNSRLATRIRQNDGLSYTVRSWYRGSSLDDGGSFGAYAISAPENSAKVKQAFIEEIDRLIKDGFEQEEIDAAKTGWLQSQNVSRSQDSRLTNKLNSYMRLDRSLDWDSDFEDKVKKLTLEDVNKAMQKHIDPDKMVFVRAGDFDKVKSEVKP